MNSPRRLLTHIAVSGLLFGPVVISLHLCRANDSAFSGVSGTPKPLKGEHSSIVMQSEKVSIVANDKTYDTNVDFIFRNDGQSTTVEMGFPEDSYGDSQVEKKSAFLSFATWVGGVKVPARRVLVSDGKDDEEVEAYWVKTVKFGAHQTKKIRVAYRSPMGGNTNWGTHSALTYDFTGENWKGTVDHSDLEVRITKPGLWIAVPQFDYKTLGMTMETTPQSTVFRKTWRNWQAQGYFMFGLTSAVPFWLMDRNIVHADALKPAKTFRVGPVPKELPVGAEEPDAFTRGGVTYIQLSRLEWNLEGFASDLEKYRGTKIKTSLNWNTQNRIATLQAGAKTLTFSPDTPVEPGGQKPILLAGEYDSSLYVPLPFVARKLGFKYQVDSPNRNFALARGDWTGQ